MLTPAQRREIEAKLSPEERSIVRAGRLAKAAVLVLMIAGLAWLGAAEHGAIKVQQASIVR